MENEFEITLSAEAAENLIPCLESRIKNLDERILEGRELIDRTNGEIQSYISQRDKTKVTLAELTAKLNGQKPVIKNGKFQNRLPKGYGDQLITKLLEDLPSGQALTMSEIEEKTGVNHATVFRTLMDPGRNKDRFIKNKNGKWWLKGRVPPRTLLDACCGGSSKSEGRILNEENLIREVLNGPNELGKSENQIADETGLAVPQVCAVLNRRPEMFTQGAENLWRKIK